MTRTSLDYVKFRIGNAVFRRDDPRHVGRVVAIDATMAVTVRWSNGWKEIVDDYRDLVLTLRD